MIHLTVKKAKESRKDIHKGTAKPREGKHAVGVVSNYAKHWNTALSKVGKTTHEPFSAGTSFTCRLNLLLLIHKASAAAHLEYSVGDGIYLFIA